MGRNVGGIGTDVVDVSRIASAAKRPGFLDRIYSASELQYSFGGNNEVTELAAQRLAVRFAAKEATLKALGVGLGAVKFRDIEVAKADSGAPELILTGSALELSDSLNFCFWLVSLSHTDSIAQAFVVAMKQ